MLSPRAWRDLKKLALPAAQEILEDLERCPTSPLPGPPRVKKIRGGKGYYRLRTGDYRSVFMERDVDFLVLRIVVRKDLERMLARLL